MRIIEKYVDEITGQEFDTKEACGISEERNKDLKNLFSFWKLAPNDGTCRFLNGEWCYQRLKKDVEKLLDTVIRALRKYERKVVDGYSRVGGLKEEHILIDFLTNKPILRDYNMLTHNICMKCYREWGQPYYANNCTCDAKPKDLRR